MIESNIAELDIKSMKFDNEGKSVLLDFSANE